MSATFSTFCEDVIADAAIRPHDTLGRRPIMTLSLMTDTGDYLTVHFRDETNFKAFCAKHNFPLEVNRNATKN